MGVWGHVDGLNPGPEGWESQCLPSQLQLTWEPVKAGRCRASHPRHESTKAWQIGKHLCKALQEAGSPVHTQGGTEQD